MTEVRNIYIVESGDNNEDDKAMDEYLGRPPSAPVPLGILTPGIYSRVDMVESIIAGGVDLADSSSRINTSPFLNQRNRAHTRRSINNSAQTVKHE